MGFFNKIVKLSPVGLAATAAGAIASKTGAAGRTALGAVGAAAQGVTNGVTGFVGGTVDGVKWAVWDKTTRHLVNKVAGTEFSGEGSCKTALQNSTQFYEPQTDLERKILRGCEAGTELGLIGATFLIPGGQVAAAARLSGHAALHANRARQTAQLATKLANKATMSADDVAKASGRLAKIQQKGAAAAVKMSNEAPVMSFKHTKNMFKNGINDLRGLNPFDATKTSKLSKAFTAAGLLFSGQYVTKETIRRSGADIEANNKLEEAKEALRELRSLEAEPPTDEWDPSGGKWKDDFCEASSPTVSEETHPAHALELDCAPK